MRVGSLLVARGAEVVLLADRDQNWQAFAAAVDAEARGGGCRVGVGEAYDSTSEVPRSYRQARLAMRVVAASTAKPHVAVFADLGVYRVLAGLEETGEVESFVERWLGDLLAYDARRGAALVDTLSRYLESGGGYDAAAAALNVHRSTLKYRLKRIAEVSGHDLGDADTAFNLQLATRARQTMAALREG
jgi:DNA-binding PucR family transcriptional regulator